MDQEGYIVYSITKKVSNEIEDGETEVLPITAHRLVADLFLPNYWPELKRNQLHAHHLDHTKMNNRWTNLVLVPIIPFNLHYYLNRVNRIMFSDGAALEEMNPYHILRQTDLTMEELILPLRREPDMLETWNGRPLFIYKLRDSFIGFELTEAEFMRREERKRKEDR